MKYYLTKYALTKGIQEIEGTLVESDIDKNTPYVRFGRFGLEKLNESIFEAKKQAIEKANKMRLKKILNLEKQIKKLETLTFE